MSESFVEVMEPQFQEKLSIKEKTPAERLQEAIRNPDLNTDQVLNVFERDYIPSLETFNPHDVDTEIMLISDLPGRVISDPTFSEKIVDLPNANDKRLDGLPSGISAHLAIDDKGEWGHAQFRKFPEDPKWTRYWQLIEKYSQKTFQIVESNPGLVKDYSGDSDKEKILSMKNEWGRMVDYNYGRWINEVKEKSTGKDLISSGQWLGHGTFLSNVEKMLENGGKMKSAYHVLNSGGNREDIYGDIKGGEAHKAFIFFFHWKYEDYQHPVDVVGKYGTEVNGQAILSDVSIFFPVDTIYRNELAIGSYLGKNSTSEFFVTKSPQLVTEERRFSKEEISEVARNDQTELSLDQAFFRVNTTKKNEDIKSLFVKFGYTEDWINNHIYFEKPGSGREVIREWLKLRPYGKVQVPPHKPVKYGDNNYLWESTK